MPSPKLILTIVATVVALKIVGPNIPFLKNYV